jgi:DeoR family fructose operon transcriptional repressor
MGLLAPERHGRILEKLRSSGAITVQGIASELSVTRETVRRDLDQLEMIGSLQRVHGGAVPVQSSTRAETSWRLRHTENAEAKHAIARAAADLLPATKSASIIMDAGTTTEALADILAETGSAPTGLNGSAPGAPQSLALITNAMPIAQKLADTSSVDVEILGGTVRKLTGAVVGDSAIETLRHRHADIAFIGANGLDAVFGASTPDPDEAALKSALIAAAEHVVLLIDGSKFDRRSLVKFAELHQFDTVITDAEPPAQVAVALAKAGVTLMEAGMA